jgi:hypothetical protein
VPWQSCTHAPPTSTGTSTTTPGSNEPGTSAVPFRPGLRVGQGVREPSALAATDSADGTLGLCIAGPLMHAICKTASGDRETRSPDCESR